MKYDTCVVLGELWKYGRNCISLNNCTSQLIMPSDNICTKLKLRLEYFVRFKNMKYELKKISVICVADLF